MRAPARLATLLLLAAACSDASVDPSAAPPVALTGAMPVQAVLGLQRVLVLVTRVTDAAPPYPESDATLLSLADAQLSSFGSFMSTGSYGRAWYQFDRRGPINLPSSVCASGDSSTTQRAILAAAVQATDPVIDYSTVRQIVVYTTISGTSCNLGSSGQRRQLWPSITTAEGTLDSSVAWASTALFEVGFGTLAHEYAHTIGGAHLEPKVCTANGVRVPIEHSTLNAQRCVIAPPYYLSHEPLGFTTTRQFALPRKLFWGWVPTSEMVAPAATGGFFLRATEATSVTSSEARALRVPVAPSATYGAYVLEYRDGTGADSGQSAGVYLYADRMSATFSIPDLVEPPPFASQTEFTAKPLAVGQSYTDPSYGMTFTLQAATSGTALVWVELGESCTPGAKRSCCYYPGYPCDGTMTCSSASRWGKCFKKCFHTLCL